MSNSEGTKLLKSGGNIHPSPGSLAIAAKSFVIATSFSQEVKLTFLRCMLISVQMLSELGAIIVAIIFVGQLPNSALYLSGVGFARTFVNVTGTAMAWGFTTSLFTLLPQSIGAGHTRLAAIHIQRSFYIVTIISALLSIAQFFAGDIMVAIGQPAELKPIVNTYCRLLIPYIFLTAYGAILMRLSQSLDMNVALTWCALLMLGSCPILTWFFMFYLNCGYYGAAIAQCGVMFIFFVAMFIMLLSKGYGYIFKPLPITTIWTAKGIYQYLALAIPGLFQNAFEWIIEEVAVILAGYVINPTIALSTTVILSNLFLIVISFSVGICNATNLRVGKYIGKGNVKDAQRAGRVGVMIAIFIMVIIGLVFVFGKNILPRIYTNNEDTIALTSKMMGIMVAYSCGCVILQTVGGIYRGLGIQKIAAVFVFVSYWVISLPTSIILLFYFDFRNDLTMGVTIIWGALAFGNILGCIAQIIYLLGCANWKKAVDKSESRIKHTMREYQSTKNYDRNMNKNENNKLINGKTYQ